ncbi:hypothetical protein [Chryseobacterium culicis]|uniref:Lipoprotein n=1 Tax=Chryseobacterium culicis TaxID=680127 RepID=A0A1H6HH53_CHRCI|nr:hypothetical protein [Chryseobacterium culicis]SEH35091.1 hypothetical protein SAMN05421593_2878 [Chryseobacterium culicis]
MKKGSKYLGIVIALISCTSEKELILTDIQPKTINQIKKMSLYEYNNILPLQTSSEKNIFYSNIKPDNIRTSRSTKPLGRLVYIDEPKVLEYFDKKNHNKFVYYHYRNDSLISKVYLVDNLLESNSGLKNKSTITSLDQVKNLLSSSNIKYSEEDIYNDAAIQKKYNIDSVVKINGEKTFLIDNKYPAIVYSTNKLFYIEIIYNKLSNGQRYNWMLEK